MFLVLILIYISRMLVVSFWPSVCVFADKFSQMGDISRVSTANLFTCQTRLIDI